MLAEFNSDGIGMMLAVLWCKGTFSCSLEDNRDESASQMEEEHSLAFDFSHFLSFFLSVFDKNVMNTDVSVIALVRRDVNGDRE